MARWINKSKLTNARQSLLELALGLVLAFVALTSVGYIIISIEESANQINVEWERSQKLDSQISN